MIGSFLVDVIMERNEREGMNCRVYALGRSEEKARARFEGHADHPLFNFIPYDINRPFVRDDIGTVDFVLHLASNTHPMQYSTDPIGTITTNIIGLQNMLEFACAHGAERLRSPLPTRSTGRTAATWNCSVRITAAISTAIHCGPGIRRASGAAKLSARHT